MTESGTDIPWSGWRRCTGLDSRGELWFIEVKKDGRFIPIGDVTFWKEDMPIVIGDRAFRGKGVAGKVVRRLIERGRELGYDRIYVSEIYSFNTPSRRCFESAGFTACERMANGDRYCLKF